VRRGVGRAIGRVATQLRETLDNVTDSEGGVPADVEDKGCGGVYKMCHGGKVDERTTMVNEVSERSGVVW
jgi:hypothetical protein